MSKIDSEDFSFGTIEILRVNGAGQEKTLQFKVGHFYCGPIDTYPTKIGHGVREIQGDKHFYFEGL